MSYYDSQIITLRLSPEFLRTLKVETEWAQLADGIHTSIPDSLLHLATIVLANSHQTLSDSSLTNDQSGA